MTKEKQTIEANYHKKMNMLVEELRHVGGILDQLGWKEQDNSTYLTYTCQPGYNTGWPMRQKIFHILESTHLQLTLQEIIGIIIKFEPDKRSQKRKLLSTISSALSVKLRSPNSNLIAVDNEKGRLMYRVLQQQ